jgi:hypothetical protein
VYTFACAERSDSISGREGESSVDGEDVPGEVQCESVFI